MQGKVTRGNALSRVVAFRIASRFVFDHLQFRNRFEVLRAPRGPFGNDQCVEIDAAMCCAKQRNVFRDFVHSPIVTDATKLTEKIERASGGGECEVKSPAESLDVKPERQAGRSTPQVWF